MQVPAPFDYERATSVDHAIGLLERLGDSARIVALVIHPYIMGAPHRLRYFREALEHIRKHDDALCWTGEQIHDWYVDASR